MALLLLSSFTILAYGDRTVAKAKNGSSTITTIGIISTKGVIKTKGVIATEGKPQYFEVVEEITANGEEFSRRFANGIIATKAIFTEEGELMTFEEADSDIIVNWKKVASFKMKGVITTDGIFNTTIQEVASNETEGVIKADGNFTTTNGKLRWSKRKGIIGIITTNGRIGPKGIIKTKGFIASNGKTRYIEAEERITSKHNMKKFANHTITTHGIITEKKGLVKFVGADSTIKRWGKVVDSFKTNGKISKGKGPSKGIIKTVGIGKKWATIGSWSWVRNGTLTSDIAD